jgi:hypothetical protein
LTIPSIVGSMITMFGITFISEIIDNRSFVAMGENIWALPFLIVLYIMPKNLFAHPWKFFVRSLANTKLLSPHSIGLLSIFRVSHQHFSRFRTPTRSK